MDTSTPISQSITSPTASSNGSENGSGLSSGGIAGIAIGAAICILLSLSVMAWYFARHSKRSRQSSKEIDSPHDFYSHDMKGIPPAMNSSGYSKLPTTEMHGGLQQPQETHTNTPSRYERLSITPDTPETHGRVWYAREIYDHPRPGQGVEVLKS